MYTPVSTILLVIFSMVAVVILLPFVLMFVTLLFFGWALGMPITLTFDDKKEVYRWFKRVE